MTHDGEPPIACEKSRDLKLGMFAEHNLYLGSFCERT